MNPNISQDFEPPWLLAYVKIMRRVLNIVSSEHALIASPAISIFINRRGGILALLCPQSHAVRFSDATKDDFLTFTY